MNTENTPVSAKDLYAQLAKQKRALMIWCAFSLGLLAFILIGMIMILSWTGELDGGWPFLLLALYDLPLLFLTWRSYKKYVNLKKQTANVQQEQTVEGDYARKRELLKQISNAKRSKLLLPILIILLVATNGFASLYTWIIIALAVFAFLRISKQGKDAQAELDKYELTEAERNAHAEETRKTNKTTVTILAVIVVIVLLISGVISSGGKSSSSGRGDGKTTCRNCGRKTTLVAGFGFCGSCYEGFNDFLEN